MSKEHVAKVVSVRVRPGEQYADVAELVDAPDLGSGAREGVWVRVPSSVPMGM
jgi:hypothetical protein